MFYDEGLKNGASKTILDYVWNVQIKRQLGYSFSINHTTPYSCIALQEMNLAYHYPILYWNTACLSINAGANEDNEDNKTTDYGKIASAIGNMQQRGVKVALPDINTAEYGFTADLKNNRIVFGLKGINGIGDDVVETIIKNRPYISFDDFREKTGISGTTLIQLIKAGCFDELENKPRKTIMSDYIKILSEPKNRLTLQNFNGIIEGGLVPETYKNYIYIFKFKKVIEKQVFKEVTSTASKGKRSKKDTLLFLNIKQQNFFTKHFTDECVVDYDNENMVISENKFKTEYEKHMDVIRTWLDTLDILHKYNQYLFDCVWNKYCSGSISKWEMDSLSFYYHEHELTTINNEKYGIVDFNELPTSARVVSTYTWRGKERQKYEIVRIAGTVLDKNKNKKTVTLLTTTGVVTVKFHDNFTFYDKQISKEITDADGKKAKQVLEGSWFKRGNKILVCGLRRENQFKSFKYKDTIYQHSVALIQNIDQDGNLILKTKREGADENGYSG